MKSNRAHSNEDNPKRLSKTHNTEENQIGYDWLLRVALQPYLKLEK